MRGRSPCTREGRRPDRQNNKDEERDYLRLSRLGLGTSCGSALTVLFRDGSSEIRRLSVLAGFAADVGSRQDGCQQADDENEQQAGNAEWMQRCHFAIKVGD